MIRLFRVLLILVVAILGSYGLFRERHEIHPMREGDPKRIAGLRFVEGATVDSYIRRDGRLFDIYTLSQIEATEKDCKT